MNRVVWASLVALIGAAMVGWWSGDAGSWAQEAGTPHADADWLPTQATDTLALAGAGARQYQSVAPGLPTEAIVVFDVPPDATGLPLGVAEDLGATSEPRPFPFAIRLEQQLPPDERVTGRESCTPCRLPQALRVPQCSSMSANAMDSDSGLCRPDHGSRRLGSVATYSGGAGSLRQDAQGRPGFGTGVAHDAGVRHQAE